MEGGRCGRAQGRRTGCREITGLDWTGQVTGMDYAKAVLCLNSLVERVRFSKALMGESMSGRELKRNE